MAEKKNKNKLPLVLGIIGVGILLLILAFAFGSKRTAYNKAVDSFNQGVEAYNQEKWSEAYTLFRKAAEKNVPNAAQWSEMSSARASLERKNYEMAKQCLDRLLTMECSEDMRGEAEQLLEFVQGRLG